MRRIHFDHCFVIDVADDDKRPSSEIVGETIDAMKMARVLEVADIDGLEDGAEPFMIGCVENDLDDD